uniref:Uncharacterized protein n=1 Tax=uncultured prokaryote TaxID=198431 RepID=A0A0H5Q4N6_9ZZZZ|nr:hypothetical protein [uncultured prokaryote]
MKLYPTAGEATVCVVVPPNVDEDPLAAAERPPADPVACWQRANRRARTRSRRYIVHNRLRFMWVLTTEGAGIHGPEGRAEMMVRVAAAVRRLRAEIGPVPYWYSPEMHPGGHGWHCNLFLPRYVPRAVVERCWQGGFVWVKDWTKDTRVAGQTFVEKLRAGAEYGAKYAAKDWSTGQLVNGAHRYELAEGFEPPEVLAECRQLAEGVALAQRVMGRASVIWRSADAADWDGPACVTLRFPAAGRSGSPRRQRAGPSDPHPR